MHKQSAGRKGLREQLLCALREKDALSLQPYFEVVEADRGTVSYHRR